MESAVPKQATRQLQEPQVVYPMLVVPHQQSSALAQPTQRPLHHPPAWFVPFPPVTRFLLVADPADVRLIATRLRCRTTARVVVPFVQTQVLFDRLGVRSFDQARAVGMAPGWWLSEPGMQVFAVS
jgi:hypothetical protein